MRLSVEWIKEYAPIEAGAEELAERLTMAGLEVEETEETALGPVLNITVTPNRGDCLSVIGVARELAAAYNVQLKPVPGIGASDPAGIEGMDVSVTIEDPDLCPRYAARMVRNIVPGESPAWMQARLEAAGMRPVSNIVDVTNYVMLEMGQPLHAFDYNRLAGGRIVVRRAKPGEKITTLDGVERELAPSMLMICDAEKPVAVAGIMGGATSEMNLRTKTMLLESAHFNSISVRRTSRALSLRTEASYRFERVVDPEGVVAAADRACALIAELGMGEVIPGAVDAYPVPGQPREIPVRAERVTAMLGFEVTHEQVTDTLQRLGFQPRPEKKVFVVPSWRPDVVREIDAVEEVGRVLGYEHIPEKLPVGATVQGGDTAYGRFAERVRALLAGAGLQEIISHTLLAPTELENRDEIDQRIAIRSALSAELSGLRRSLLPGLLDSVERNARRGQSPLALFEVGRVFHRGKDGYEETSSVGGALVGPLVPASWQRDSRQGPADFYTDRGLVERLAGALGIEGLTFERSQDPRLHPGRSAEVRVNGKPIGFVGELHPRLGADLTVRDRVIVFELSFEALQAASQAGRRFAPLSPFPAVVRDLAPRVAADLPYARVEQAVTSTQIPFLEGVDLTDVYAGKPLPEDVKSLTLSFTFRADDRTLNEGEVNGALQTLRAALEAECGASFPA